MLFDFVNAISNESWVEHVLDPFLLSFEKAILDSIRCISTVP